MVDNDSRFSRQIDFFGADGQRQIHEARVVVVGLGGLGSHITQQLTYLGVRKFVLIDHDTTSTSNLNRLIGATPTDAENHILKTDVARRVIQSIEPQASVMAYPERLPHDDFSKWISSADIVIGCVDNDYARTLILDAVSSAQIPYVDAASDINDDGVIYGGRVLVSGQKPGCLNCMELLDKDDIRRRQAPVEQLEVEARSYGVPVSQLLPGTGPSVVTINGVVGSLAATEVMAIITGLRPGVRLQTYRGDWGKITRSLDEPIENCYYCTRWLAPVTR